MYSEQTNHPHPQTFILALKHSSLPSNIHPRTKGVHLLDTKITNIIPSPEPVLSAKEARFFESEGLLSPLVGNKRKLSTSLLSDTPPFSPNSRSRCSSDRVSSESFKATFTSQEVEISTVPETLESVESLEYMGFTTNMADTIYNRYQNAPEDIPWTLLEFALAVIEDPQ